MSEGAPLEPLIGGNPSGGPGDLAAGDGQAIVDPEQLAQRGRHVSAAVKTWTGQLVDLGGRNNLLYYKDLRRGTLDLGEAKAAPRDNLLAGKKVRLTQLFGGGEALEDAVKRARTVRNKSQEGFEERGLLTLYLACGMVTWQNQKSSTVPAAPVLLCPMHLAPRGGAQDDFDLSLTSELEVNPTLLHLLKTDFRCECDPEELLGMVDIEGPIDTPEELETAFDWLRDKATGVPGFAITQRFVVANFSYAKLPMVNDLQGAEDELAQHDLIAAIAGDAGARDAIRQRQGEVKETDPNYIPVADEFLVLDADSSQNYAINAVVGGQDLIIKGPPGTGKSQTISNMIATLLARGKKVLFVAEKRAAIDAVLSRLEHVDLDDLVLDLHGGTGSRRKTAEDIARTLTTNSMTAPAARPTHHANLEKRRQELLDVAEASGREREPWRISVYEAQAELLGVPGAAHTDVRFRGPQLQTLDASAYEQAREDLAEYVGLGALTLNETESPWARARVTSSDQARGIYEHVDRLAQHTLPSSWQTLETVGQQVGLRSPTTVAGWQSHLDLWREIATTLDTFEPELFEEDLDELCSDLTPAGEGSLKRAGATITSPDFRAARKQVKAHLREGKKLGSAGLYDACVAARDQNARFREAASDDSSVSLPSDLQRLETLYGQLRGELDHLGESLNADQLAERDEEDLRALLKRLLGDQATLTKLPRLYELWGSLELAGLSGLLHELGQRQLAADLSLDCLKYAWLRSIVEHVGFDDPLVGSFDGERHNARVAEFRDWDVQHIETTAARVRRRCAEHATAVLDEFPDETALIRHQANLKRKHLPLRQLFESTPNVLTALKPCWAMSPLVVSQTLPAQKCFDVVIFDEASQITPAEAIPAILRGHCAVVAGDDKQLPPTAFFASSTHDGEDEEEEAPPQLAAIDGFESILAALGALVPFRMLQWHYRSHDERLIAFSNSYLYDRGLTTFPGVTGEECLEHVVIPFQLGQVGQEQSVSAEVDEVVKRIIRHAETRPDETLGVIAMGIKHANRIEECLRDELSERRDLDEFFDETREERFFVKNLERVQGDERDAIMLTVGYGKNPEGKMLYRFGPINNEGGERRLNVAVTRAKRRMTLISSFSASDMDPERTTSEGANLLRLYLQYAESRGSNLGNVMMEKPKLNPFEIDVRDTLKQAGIPVVPQYGCSGFWIDYAAQHPTKPGQMVLAIECDGATYHSSPTARDRDRLRQDQLERLGWTFHRIWSSDWFRSKEREVERATAAYAAAVEAADQRAARGDNASTRREQQKRQVEAPSVLPRGPRPALGRRSNIDEFDPDEIIKIVDWIEADGLLRTEDQLLDETIRELGFRRRGAKIVARITGAIIIARLARSPS